MQPNLPPGWHSSPVKPEYEEGVVEAINAAFRQMNGGDFTTLEEMRINWQDEIFNPATDTHVVISPDGIVAGYIDVWDATALHVRWISQGFVHPDYAGRGVGGYLLDWSVERGKQQAALAQEGVRVVLHQFVNSANQAACDLFIRHGFKVARQSFRMGIDLSVPPSQPRIPDGITIRPVQPGEEHVVLHADYEAFQDHWGFTEEPFDAFFKRWVYYMKNDPNHDPALWFVAMDGDRVAGVSLCNPRINEDPQMGWVASLAVRRPWRKHGLGLALLLYSFQEFYRRGIPRAGLGVDSENLTGALRLYEKAGMHVRRKNNTYEYELRPGADLMKKELD